VNQCPVCGTGELKNERVETWMRNASQWVLFSQVPAMRCDVCGETTFSQAVAERLAEILASGSTERATGSRWSPEFDLEKLDSARSDGETPRIGATRTG
jgi:YgiT-type zinc finger domain-containing protein